MSKIFDFMAEMETKLKRISGVKTLAIGMEKGIGSKDTPFIRIIPESNSKQKQGGGCQTGGYDQMTVQIIFGFDIKNKDLPKLYESFYDMEEQIRETLVSKYTSKGTVTFMHTVTDEDKLTTIKSAISRFEISGIR